jgi:hypothetical protein
LTLTKVSVFEQVEVQLEWETRTGSEKSQADKYAVDRDELVSSSGRGVYDSIETCCVRWSYEMISAQLPSSSSPENPCLVESVLRRCIAVVL